MLGAERRHSQYTVLFRRIRHRKPVTVVTFGQEADGQSEMGSLTGDHADTGR